MAVHDSSPTFGPLSRMAITSRAAIWSVLISGMTLLMLAGAVLLANVGASRLWFGLLLLVPVTIGLPSTCGVLLVTSLWNGPPLWAYWAVVGITAVSFQWLCMGAWYRWRRRTHT